MLQLDRVICPNGSHRTTIFDVLCATSVAYVVSNVGFDRRNMQWWNGFEIESGMTLWKQEQSLHVTEKACASGVSFMFKLHAGAR